MADSAIVTATEFRPTPKQLLLYPGVGILIAASQLLNGNVALAAGFAVGFTLIEEYWRERGAAASTSRPA